MVAQAFNPTTQESEEGKSLSLGAAWSTKLVPEQQSCSLHRQPLLQKIKKKKKQVNKLGSTGYESN